MVWDVAPSTRGVNKKEHTVYACGAQEEKCYCMYKTEKEISSGGVVFKKENNESRIVLISRKNNTIFCLPKGKIEKNETKEGAAIREVKEETGLDGKIIDFLDEVHYWYIDKKRGLRLNKTVYLYLMECLGGDISLHDGEVDSVEWFDTDKALVQATYPSERGVLEKAKAILLKND